MHLAGPEWCFRARYTDEIQGEALRKEEQKKEIDKEIHPGGQRETEAEIKKQRQRQHVPLVSANSQCLRVSPSVAFVLGCHEILVNSPRRSFVTSCTSFRAFKILVDKVFLNKTV